MESIKQARLKKLKAFRRKGINPYPAKAERTDTCREAIDNFDQLAAKKKEIILVGRLRTIREHGGSTFAHLKDGSAKFQIYFKKDELGEKEYRFFLANFDVGDFINQKRRKNFISQRLPDFIQEFGCFAGKMARS